MDSSELIIHTYRRRRRLNIGRRTVNARRLRSARHEESSTEREARLSQARETYRAKIQKEVEREARRTRARNRYRIQSARESSVEREARLGQLRDRRRAERERESSVEREARRTRDRDRHRIQRARESSARVTNSWIKGELEQKELVAELRTQLINRVYKIEKITGRQSKVFDLFGKIIDDKGQEVANYVVCKQCLSVFKFLGSSSNLVKHKCYKIIKNQNEKQEVYANVDAKYKQAVEDAVMKWNIESVRSSDVIRDSGLQNLMSLFISLGAKYGKNIDISQLLPQASDVAKRIQELYCQAMSELKLEIDSIRDVGYGITTDVWSTRNKYEPFLFVTIHYIKNGQLVQRFLGTETIYKTEYTSSDIKETIQELLTEFDLTLDNGDIILTNNEETMAEAFCSKNHIFCINYLLDTTLDEAMQTTPEIAEICNTAGSLYSFLSEIDTLQEEAAEVLSTRWNRMFNMLSFLIKNWDRLIDECTKTNKKDISKLIADFNINDITALVEVLKPFQESFHDLNKDNCITLHLVIVHVHRLRKLCVKNQVDLGIIKKFKFNLLKSFDTFVLQNMTLQHKLALYLFPPTNKLISFSQADKDLVRSECKKLMEGFTDEPETDVAHSTIQIDDKDAIMEFLDELPSTSTASKSNINPELFSEFIQPTARLTSAQEIVINEMRLYEEAVVSLHGDFDILKWWHMHQSQYPLLYKVSCKILPVPASSIMVEQVILKARPLIFENQDENMVNQTLFLHFNMDKKEASSDVTMDETI